MPKKQPLFTKEQKKTFFKSIIAIILVLGIFWGALGVRPAQIPSYTWEKMVSFGKFISTEVGYFFNSSKKLHKTLDREINQASDVYHGRTYLEVPDPNAPQKTDRDAEHERGQHYAPVYEIKHHDE